MSQKCDVYSFGVVLMDLVMGRQPIELEFGGMRELLARFHVILVLEKAHLR